jgi:hypothetical protein
VLGIGIRGPARDNHPLKESTTMSRVWRKKARRKKRRVFYMVADLSEGEFSVEEQTCSLR